VLFVPVRPRLVEVLLDRRGGVIERLLDRLLTVQGVAPGVDGTPAASNMSLL
jgi:hypothetical protein